MLYKIIITNYIYLLAFKINFLDFKELIIFGKIKKTEISNNNEIKTNI